MTVAQHLEAIREQLDAADADAVKADRGMKAPATRVRRALQEIKRLAGEGRRAALVARHEAETTPF